MLALYLGMLDADLTIADSPELEGAPRTLTRRNQRARRQPAGTWLAPAPQPMHA